MRLPLVILAAAACAACSQEPAAPSQETATAEASPAPGVTPPATATPPDTPSPDTLALEGFGGLRIGEPIPAGSSWAERGAQASDVCRTVSSPEYPGVYAIVEDGRVRRISAGQRSTVKLAEGIGVGASEAEVREAFPGFREEPHAYVAAPGKYLTAPNAESGDPALRFEIDADRKVSEIHIGTMPVLGYVEACS